MKIVIETIPHAKQRYETCGDWYYKRDPFSHEEVLHVRVSESGDWRTDALVAVHELVEVLLCKQAGVTQEQADEFDKQFNEKAFGRFSDGTLWAGAEPGDEKDAPYRDQHCFAMSVERMLCAAMGYSWKEHEERIDAL